MKQCQLLSLVLLLNSHFSLSWSADRIWLLVDTQALTIEVKQNHKTLKIFQNIAIGRKGAGFKQHKGDDITPLGLYKIAWINQHSPFHRFYGLNYPSVDDANRAIIQGLLTIADYNRVIQAHDNHQIPPQNTPLGGKIGLHGLGLADRSVHQFINWTHGCIALTDEQIDQLAKWVKIGTVVQLIASP